MNSKKILKIILISLVFLMVLAVPYFILAREKHPEPYEKIVKIENEEVYVEVADTPEERTMGLMGRKSMHDDHGMLFMFMEDGQHAFWMKNTYIPLDIIFLGKDMRVSDMKKNFEPCASSNCRVFTPRTNVKYVLEVNAGFADRNGIEYGSQMKIY